MGDLIFQLENDYYDGVRVMSSAEIIQEMHYDSDGDIYVTYTTGQFDVFVPFVTL